MYWIIWKCIFVYVHNITLLFIKIALNIYAYAMSRSVLRNILADCVYAKLLFKIVEMLKLKYKNKLAEFLFTKVCFLMFVYNTAYQWLHHGIRNELVLINFSKIIITYTWWILPCWYCFLFYFIVTKYIKQT